MKEPSMPMSCLRKADGEDCWGRGGWLMYQSINRSINSRPSFRPSFLPFSFLPSCLPSFLPSLLPSSPCTKSAVTKSQSNGPKITPSATCLCMKLPSIQMAHGKTQMISHRVPLRIQPKQRHRQPWSSLQLTAAGSLSETSLSTISAGNCRNIATATDISTRHYDETSAGESSRSMEPQRRNLPCGRGHSLKCLLKSRVASRPLALKYISDDCCAMLIDVAHTMHRLY